MNDLHDTFYWFHDRPNWTCQNLTQMVLTEKWLWLQLVAGEVWDRFTQISALLFYCAISRTLLSCCWNAKAEFRQQLFKECVNLLKEMRKDTGRSEKKFFGDFWYELSFRTYSPFSSILNIKIFNIGRIYISSKPNSIHITLAL